MEFKLPIQYVSHHELDSTVMHELELVESEEIPIYDRFFKPKTPEATHIAHQWAKYYTTDQEFLTESVTLFQNAPKPITIKSFVTHWKEIQSSDEFKMKYQYVESNWFSCLNTSSSFLMFISIYFMASPVLFMLSPFLMVLTPFVVLRLKQLPITWHTYRILLKNNLSSHALGGLINFSTADSKTRAYLIGTALFFMVQLYTNVYAFYTFVTNMNYIQKVVSALNLYLKTTMETMDQVRDIMGPLKTYKGFEHDLTLHKAILHSCYEKSRDLNHHVTQYGKIRCLFYELHENEELKRSIEYSFGFHGFVHNIRRLKKQITKKCTFSDKTSFVNAYYPTSSPVKNTYTLNNTIITGPNASGKTTMLKTTFINILLSQQVSCGFYKSATICPYDSLQCYINIPDTSGRDSLFQAEARRCKEIVDEVVKHKRIFCIFDELFSGTNPQEASASVCSLLTFLSLYPTFNFLMTTHFLNVCEELNEMNIEMKHMKTDSGKYTYKLSPGISYAKGGINVLEQLQFPDSIVKEARMRTK